LKRLDLNTKILDLYGLPFPGKPEFIVEADGERKPVYAESGRQNRLDLTLSDLIAEQLVNGAVDVDDGLDDDKAFKWAKELDETGSVTMDGEDVVRFDLWIKRLKVTRIVRSRIKSIWDDAFVNMTTLVEHNIS
jgi:hypothetical protein